MASVLAALGVMAVGASAAAQTGWSLNRYEPAPTGDAFFLAEHPWYSETRRFSVGLQGDLALNPLVLRVERDGQATETVPVVSSMFSAHLGAAVAITDRIGLHLSLPVSLSQSGNNVADRGIALAAASSPALGDLRVGARLRILGHADRDAFSLHLGVNAWLPTGSAANNTGDDRVRVEPRLVLAGRASMIRWSFSGGFTVRGERSALNIALGNELRFSGGVAVVLADERLHIGPEAYLYTPLGDVPNSGGSALFAERQWGGEVGLGARYLIADAVQVGVAGTGGIQTGYGVPSNRVLLSVAYAPITRVVPPPPDTDGDGVLDPNDACVDVPQGPNPDPNRAGCPRGDRDSDGVFDDEDQCVDVAQGETPDPNRRGCPLEDRDHDGVVDGEDQCPDTAQGEHPDPARRGCPEGDRDSDGVLDSADQCVDVPAGPRPSTVRAGCPAPDADHDNIIDQPEGPDQCPDRPETFNGITDEDGCPDGTALAEQVGTQIRIIEQVNFRTDSDEITGARSFEVLNAVLSVFRSLGAEIRIDVQGHTDDRGAADHNRDLSQRRATSVVHYLTEHGVDAARLEAHGFGPDCPIQAGTSRAARRANRRVQFIIVSSDTPAGRCVSADGSVQGTRTVVPSPAPAAAAPVARHRGHRH
ncbi:MAG: OmpA family protein [Myxococcales bacterium]|nr:OmpA family protein [Myxococcales bacterium]